MAALASVTDVEDVAGAVPASDHDRIDNLILKVSALVRRYTGQTFDLVEDDEVIVYPRDGIARLPQQPVVSITSIEVSGAALVTTSYTFTENGYITPVIPPAWANWVDGCVEWQWPPNPMTVTYTHGFAETPLDVALVVAERVADVYRFGADSVSSESIDGYSASYARASLSAPWAPSHKMILDSYRRSGLASLRLS